MTMKDDELPVGVVALTPEMLAADGPLATAIRTNCAKGADAPAMREGAGWAGMLAGFCPVQGYGNVDGLNWYFRARHEHWSFEVWKESFGPGGDLPESDTIWSTEAEYGDAEFNASWMPYSHAWAFIEQCIERLRTERNGGRKERR